MLRVIGHLGLIMILTLLTQVGGLVWMLALLLRRRLLAFVLAYVALSASAVVVAPNFGRTAIGCTRDGPLQVQSWMYCALNRTYVTPETLAVLEKVAASMPDRFPRT